MKPLLRVSLVVAVFVFVALAGWRIWGLLQAEKYAIVDPALALRWHAGQPDAVWAEAEQRLAQGDRAGAARLARSLLAREPIQGRAFRMLAGIAAQEGRSDEALRLYRIAAKRAPRDSQAISGLVQQYMERGDYPQAMYWIDFYLRTSPDGQAARGRILPQLVSMSLDGRFAGALVEILRGNPPWRADMMKALLGNPTAASRVLEELEQDRNLTPTEFNDWINGLIVAGEWSEANRRWLARLGPQQADRPLLENGGFHRAPSGAGFDWRLSAPIADAVSYVPMEGGRRRALGLRFNDQPLRAAQMEHALYLPAGDYALRMHMRARGLRGRVGLIWQLSCAGTGGVLATSDLVQGSFDWMEWSLLFTVPSNGCPGQWLRLSSPVEGAAGQRMDGELWIDNVRISSVTPHGM